MVSQTQKQVFKKKVKTSKTGHKLTGEKERSLFDLYLPLSTVLVVLPISACTACGNEPVDRLVEVVVVARNGMLVVSVEVVILEPAKLTGWFLEVCRIEVG